MPDRLRCIAPFCRCTTQADRHPPGWEIMCAKHWRAEPRTLKICRRRSRAAVRTLAAADEAARQGYLACPKAQVFRPGPDLHPLEAARWRAVHRLIAAEQRDARLWRICKRRAVEAAGGIG